MTVDPTAAGWTLREDPGLPVAVRPLWWRHEGEGWAFAFETHATHANAQGLVHGGVLATFMDHTLGRLVREAVGGGNVATIQLDLHYVASARPGALVEARGEVVRQTRSVVFVRGTLAAEATVVLTASGIWKVLAGGGSPAQPGPRGDPAMPTPGAR